MHNHPLVLLFFAFSLENHRSVMNADIFGTLPLIVPCCNAAQIALALFSNFCITKQITKHRDRRKGSAVWSPKERG
jgi:hypothetical protein